MYLTNYWDLGNLEQGLNHEDVLLLKSRKKTRRKTFSTVKEKRKKRTKITRSGSALPFNNLLLGDCALPALLFDTMKWIEINGM